MIDWSIWGSDNDARGIHYLDMDRGSSLEVVGVEIVQLSFVGGSIVMKYSRDKGNTSDGWRQY